MPRNIPGFSLVPYSAVLSYARPPTLNRYINISRNVPQPIYQYIKERPATLENLLNRGKKLRIISAMFLISQLGGYVGSVIFRETDLSSLIWFSDRDSTNEIGNNLIRDLFQISLIDITKKNINFSFTTANSKSDEWYKEITRIPDYITGAVSDFNFGENRAINQKTAQMLGFHFSNNTKNTFLYKFKLDNERIRLQRMLISKNI